MFKLKANPTFKAKVEIKGHGTAFSFVAEFKHRTKTELEKWGNAPETLAKGNTDYLMDFVVGWDGVDEKFSREAVEELCENYIHAAIVLRQRYFEELSGARLGN